MNQPRSLERLPWWALLALAASLVVGSAFLFVGIGRSSLWYDELFTLWVVTPTQASVVIDRIISDVHPPLYYALAWLWFQASGQSADALRLFSALCTAGALATFLIWLPLRWPARLFGAALAVNSVLVVSVSQQARNYGLLLWLITVMAVLAMRILKSARPHPAQLAGIILCGLLAALAHPFGMLTACSCLAALIMLRLPLLRWLGPAVLAIGLVFAAWQYLVIVPNTQFNLGQNWIPDTWRWVARQTGRAMVWLFGVYGLLAVGLLAWPALRRLRAQAGPPREAAALLVMVPVFVWLASALLSVLVAPNISDRNLLVAAPFGWCLAALIFDLAMAHGGTGWRRLLAVACMLAVLSASIVETRLRATREPFREVGEAIAADPRCRGTELAAINQAEPGWARRAFADRVEAFIQSYQLGHGNRARNLFVADIVDGSADARLGQMIDRALAGCPYIGFNAHNVWSTQPWTATMAAASRVAATRGARVKLVTVAQNQEIGASDYILLHRPLRFTDRVRDGVLLKVEPAPPGS